MSIAQEAKDYFRYCPGETQIKISNAICRGRRHAHFPKCHGCQFNDDEKAGNFAAPHAAGAEKPVDEFQSLFRASDIVGAVPSPLSDDVAWRIGHATGQFLHGRLRGLDRADPNIRTMIVGRDLRPHSKMLSDALADGIRSTGLDVTDIGEVDVALVYYVVHQFGACGGVMVTGGPYAADRGGFKICGTRAFPIGTATGLASIRDIAGRVPRHRSGATSKVARRDMSRPYRQFIRRFTHTPRPAEKPVALVADAMGGVAGKWIPKLFTARCGMHIHPLHFEPNCLGRTRPDPTAQRQQTVLRRAVRARKASFGIGFDGDADRCTILDERGGLVPPDRVAALLARRFIEREPGAAIVFDLRFSSAAFEEVLRAGGSVFRERVGAAHIKKTMTDRHAVFAADLDGRYYYRDNAFSESAMLTMVHVANLLRETGCPLSELVRPLNRYRTSDEVRLPSDDADRAIRRLVSAHHEAEIEELDGVTLRYDDWWFNARPDDAGHLSVVVEARSRKLVDQHLTELEQFLAGIESTEEAPVGST